MKHVSRKVIAIGLVGAIAAVVVTAATGAKNAGIQACGLMPDTKTSVRWEQFDKPYLQKAFKAAGISARVVNAQGDPQKQKTQADQCISDGAKVLISICSKIVPAFWLSQPGTNCCGPFLRVPFL